MSAMQVKQVFFLLVQVAQYITVKPSLTSSQPGIFYPNPTPIKLNTVYSEQNKSVPSPTLATSLQWAVDSEPE